MIKRKLLLLFISICAIWSSAKAQAYWIKSFEGQAVEVHLTEKTTDKSRYLAMVSCPTDSIFLEGYNYVNEVHILSDKFLEIVYYTQGGSGYQSRNTAILSVKGNKFIVSILVNSFGKAFGGDIDGSLYSARFKITGNGKSNLKLIAHIYDRHNSSSHPRKSYIRNKQIILNFDPVQNIFYSTHKEVNQSFAVADPKAEQSRKETIRGSFPFNAFGGLHYYYIKGQ